MIITSQTQLPGAPRLPGRDLRAEAMPMGYGLLRLHATVGYPLHGALRTLSVSRVREICTHGLKGDTGIGPRIAEPRQ